MRPVPRSRHLLAVFVFAVVAAGSAYVAVVDDDLSDSQMNLAVTAAKRHDPSLYPHDPIFGDSHLWRSDSPAFQALIELVLVPSGYQSLALPFRFLTGIVTMVYLCGMYALLYRQCRSWSISAFVAVLSCKVSWTLGGSYWGVGALSSISPGAVVGAFVPILMLLFLRYEKSWRVLLVFAGIGVFGNLDLATAMNLTLVLVGVYLGARRFHPRAWVLAAGCALAALLGALLQVGYYLGLRLRMAAAAEAAGAASVYEAFQLAGFDCLYPALFEPLLKWLPWVSVLAVPAVLVLSRVERFRVRDLGVWVWFLVAGIAVAFGLQGLSQLYGLMTDEPPPVIDFAQCASLLMLPLYALFAQALTNLFRLVRRRRGLLRWACAVSLLLWFLPSDNLRYLRRRAYDLATRSVDPAQRPRKVQRHQRRRAQRRELAEIARWARDRTEPNAVFLTRRVEFRMLSRRSIVASRDDVKYVYYLAPGRLRQWSARIREMSAVVAPKSGRADPAALRAFADKVRAETPFAGSGSWFVILQAEAAPEDAKLLEEVRKSGWGKQYRLYRIR